MKLYQPVKPFVITQQFAENRACIPVKGGSVIECDGNNPPKGYKSLYGATGHKGTDLAAFHNQPVYAAHAGTVAFIDTDPKSGLDVKVEYEENGTKYQTVYEHLLGYQPKVGDQIALGSLIGWADNTGYSSGDHLHFELKKWDGKKWVSIDCMPFMQPKFARDMGTPIRETLADLLETAAVIVRPRATSVAYERAVENLNKAPISKEIRALALKILREKYGK